MNSQMTCIECPKGCRLKIAADGSGEINVSGGGCGRGAEYARREIEAPMRTFTASVLTRGLELKMLPVRSSRPIPKEKLFAAMDAVKLLVVAAPVAAGSVVASDFLGLGADLLACRSLDKA